jgi:hypothetical protein
VPYFPVVRLSVAGRVTPETNCAEIHVGAAAVPQPAVTHDKRMCVSGKT